MKILILGKGFIGKFIANGLKDEHEIELCSKATLDYTGTTDLVDYYHYDVVINASGYTGRPNVDACEDDKEKCWHYNVTVPSNISKACYMAQVPLIHISSGCIYNGYEKIFAEEDTPNFGMFSDTSSFYSKTKHAAETILSNDYLIRIRIPFTEINTPRNYINKLLNYTSLISMQNSMTCLEDFNNFIDLFIDKIFCDERVKPGKYNVTNSGSMESKEVLELMSKYGLKNPNHRFIKLSELNTKANRSNCILSTDKIKSIGLELPDIRESMERSIIKIAGC